MTTKTLQTGRIALFTKDFRGGGAERVMVHLAGALAERGDIAVDMVVCKAVGPNLDLLPKSVRVLDLNARQMLTSLPALCGYLSKEKPVALLSALEHANVVAIAARYISRSSTRVAVSAHISLSQSLQGNISIKKRMEQPFVRAFYPFADAIVAVSEGVASDLSELTGIAKQRIHVIYNPVVSDGLVERSKEPVTHPWFGTENPPVILNVGRLTYQKDQAMLIRAFAKVRKSIEARLIVLGEGEERANLEALVLDLGLRLGIDGDVLLPGFADNPYAYMAKSRVFALSSRFEGLPTVLIEALACGSTIVSTDCPSGPTEILDGGRWGSLTPVGDSDAFAEALLAALNNRSVSITEEAWAPYRFTFAADEYRKVLLPDTNSSGQSPD